MPSNTGQRVVAGFQAVFYSLLDSSNNILGNNATTPTAGNATGNPAYRLRGAVSMTVPIPEATAVPAPGDDTVLVNFFFPADTLPEGNFVTASRDAVFEGLAQGTKVKSYLAGNILGSSPLPATPVYASMLIHGIRQTQTADESNFGVSKWQNVVYLNTKVQALFNTMETRTHAPFNYKLIVNNSNQRGTGETFTDTSDGFLLAGAYVYDTNYPYHAIRYTGDNTEDTFNLSYTPISTSEILVFVNGVPATVSAVDTTLKTFTLSSAPANNAVIVALYGFEAGEL